MNISRRELTKIRKNNARIYPMYKMFSWDLLFFYSVEFLFYTITKKITPAQILMVNSFYLFFRTIMQIPAVMITDFLGKKISIILGNLSWTLYIIVLVSFPGVKSVIFASMLLALGKNIKGIAETNLLYDSVATRGGEGLYSKIDAKGTSLYYVLDGIASITAGYLFVINQYIPMMICLGFTVISTIISFRFKDVYKVKKKEKNTSPIKTLKLYFRDLNDSFKFFMRSKRMKAFVLFQILFYGLMKITAIYNSDLLIDLGISEEHYSIIIAVVTLISGLSISLKRPIEKIFKNRTLSFISTIFIMGYIVIGICSQKLINRLVIPISISIILIQNICIAIWYVLEMKYLKNFTTEEIRNKITFTYSFIGAIAASITSFLGGTLLKYVEIRKAFLIVGMIAFVALIMVLRYMKTRFGLKPEEYSKEDIEFESFLKQNESE